MNAVMASKLIFKTIKQNLEFFIKDLFGLDKGFFQWNQTQTILNQQSSIIFFFIDEFGHFNKKILLLRDSLFAFSIDFNNFGDSFG